MEQPVINSCLSTSDEVVFGMRKLVFIILMCLIIICHFLIRKCAHIIIKPFIFMFNFCFTNKKATEDEVYVLKTNITINLVLFMYK